MAVRPDQEVDLLTKLYEASIEGSLLTFNSLIQKDPLILTKISLTPFNQTPLHIAALLGHHDFSRQLLIHKPKLSSELDSRLRSPLHLASAEGHTEVVRVLLQENGDENMCLAKDQDGKIPLHYAAMRGRIDVIKLLIGARKESVLEVMPDGQTVLHLCVRYNHLEALKVLVESEVAYEDCPFLNSNESADGNTILHLAVMLKQVETVKYLLSIPGVKTGTDDTVNHRGLKAFDLLEHFPGTDFISDIIRHTFKDLGFENSTSAAITRDHNDVAHKKSTTKSSKGKARKWFGFLKYKGDWMEDKRGSVMIVSTVIATMTYQTAINPPGGIWQETVDDGKSDNFNCSKEDKCLAGTSILARYGSGYLYNAFEVYNSISFFASLSVILLLISGVHMKNKFFMFLLTLTMCVVMTTLAATYMLCMMMVSPEKSYHLLYVIDYVTDSVWMLLLAFIILFHAVRFFYWIVKRLWRKYKAMKEGGMGFPLTFNVIFISIIIVIIIIIISILACIVLYFYALTREYNIAT